MDEGLGHIKLEPGLCRPAVSCQRLVGGYGPAAKLSSQGWCMAQGPPSRITHRTCTNYRRDGGGSISLDAASR